MATTAYQELLEIVSKNVDADAAGYIISMFSGSAAKSVAPDFKYEWVDGYTGSVGGGEFCWSVIKVNGKYYRAEWSYFSHCGRDYSYIEHTVTAVKPAQKTVTIFE